MQRTRIGRKGFEDAAERALGMIPEMFCAQMNSMTIAVEGRPPLDLLQEMEVPPMNGCGLI